MKQPIHRFLVSLTTVLMLGLAAGFPAAAAEERQIERSQSRNRLEGTWRVQITIVDCQSGEALRGPFPAMATFARGGVFITSDGSLNPAQRSPGHGAWEHVNHQTYRAVSEAFLFNMSGSFVARQRLAQTIEVDGPDAFTATVAAEVLDPTGNVNGTGCAKSVAVRLE